MDEPAFELRDATVAIVGLGLMGGSTALALHAKTACKKILAIEPRPEVCEQVVARGIADQASAELALVSKADAIILAMPVRAILTQLPRIGELARRGAIVIDLGSTKREIARAMEALPAGVQPIGGHPMCGKESAGFDAADADLFHNAVFVLTPLARTSADTIGFAKSLAAALGAQPLVLDPIRHDKIVAAVSHLPYALASALMLTALASASGEDLLFSLAASGFRDTSRLAASDTTMMIDVLLTNAENVAQAMRACGQELTSLADLIERGDEDGLRAALQRTALKRRELFK